MYNQPSSESDDQLADSLRPSTFDIAEDGDMVMLSDESTQIVTPPPRIAARFFQKATDGRRRSSAASSRRNSLSSTHSRHSHHSIRGAGSQSRHVAQHLRRASIIETRKARLADRAAHAEQVRLRAALAKSAPRISHTEERALAAQQARERYLAQVASACADEVRRAKRIAEDIKEKRLAEERRLKGGMEERLAEAEKRRAEYQRNMKRARAPSAPRSESRKPASPTGRVLSADVAVRRLQHAWRMRQRRHTVRDFLGLGFSIDGFAEMEFDDVGALLSNEKVLTSTVKILQLCGLRDPDGVGPGDPSGVRTFLSAFLILGHPDHVFSHDGDQEKASLLDGGHISSALLIFHLQDLISKSRDLIVAFLDMLSRLNATNHYTPPVQSLQYTTEVYNDFFTAFTAWKAHDSSVLVSTMIAQYVELDLIWQRIKEETEEVVKAEYKEGIRDNQILLLVRIKRLAGPEKAKTLIKDAIRKSRRSRLRKPTGNARPRAGISEQTVAPQNLPQSTETVPELPDLPAAVSGPLPPSRPAREFTKVASALPDNRLLVHELALNKEYRMEAPSIINSPTRRAVSRAVYDAMRVDIQNGLDVQWTVAMAEYVRERLLRFLNGGSNLHTLITEALDPVLVQRECSVGSFSYERFFSFVLTVLPKLCAPFRDTDLQRLSQDQTGDVIDRLARFIDFLDLMSVDYANFLLQQSVPRLIEEAPGYEYRRFQQDLEEGSIDLQSTERWWASARSKALAEAQRRDPEGIDHPANRPSWNRIYTQALTDLAITFPESDELSSSNFPATLHLDRERILKLRTDTLRAVLIGSILLTAKNLLKRDVRAQWTTEATRMWDVLSARDASDPQSPTTVAPAAALLSIIESSHTLPPSTRSALSSFITRILANSTTAATPRDPVPKLLMHRLRTHVLARLSATSSGERVRVASTASEALARSGLPEFVGRVGEMVELLGKVGEVDRAAHAKWYDEIAAKVEKGE
ncbi:MAG: hypothetical protein M4579_001180 [Chaenotheca gracillima]|nr:MAG: hypothetical protein M4579_001180 [Chaenotheca gracillima]